MIGAAPPLPMMTALHSREQASRPGVGAAQAPLRGGTAGAGRLRISADTIIAHTQPGLEGVAISEAIARIPDATEAGRRGVPPRSAMAFLTGKQPNDFARLRCVEDLFAPIAYARPLAEGVAGLEHARRLARNAPLMESALRARQALRPGSRSGRRLDFRVLARVVGQHEYRRVDLQRAIERGIAERDERRWRLRQDAECEIWATLIESELIIALRLCGDEMRQREYKTAHLPGSLRPSVAAALAWLSEPRDDDVVLDPLCGAATCLIERAHLGRYRMLLGGDHDDKSLAAGRENVGPRYKPIELRRWDAAALPLADASVTKIITNLPWGRKFGSHADNQRLYPRLLREFRRVLIPGGRAVMLTGEGRLMREHLTRNALVARSVLAVAVLGSPAWIFVCAAV